MTNGVVPLQQASHWTLGLTSNDRGAPFGNLRNVLYTLRHAPEWEGVLTYDTFAGRVTTQRPPPWGNRTGEVWTDAHDTRACEWLQEHGIPATVGVAGRGIQTVGRENGVHPVRDYLHALDRDGTPRLNTWLTRHLGVENSLYVQAVGPLISAVARVENPCTGAYFRRWTHGGIRSAPAARRAWNPSSPLVQKRWIKPLLLSRRSE